MEPEARAAQRRKLDPHLKRPAGEKGRSQSHHAKASAEGNIIQDDDAVRHGREHRGNVKLPERLQNADEREGHAGEEHCREQKL